MVTLFAVCTIAPSSAAGVKPLIPDIDADDIGAATIVLATGNAGLRSIVAATIYHCVRPPPQLQRTEPPPQLPPHYDGGTKRDEIDTMEEVVDEKSCFGCGWITESTTMPQDDVVVEH